MQADKIKLNADLIKKVDNGKEIHQALTPYSFVRVIQNGDARYLLFGPDGNSSIQGGINISSYKDLVLPYYEAATDVIGKIPHSGRALCIGLGVGFIPRIIKDSYGCHVDVVEVDREIYNIARKYFDFPDNISVHIDDGCNFVMKSKDKYDFIFSDAYIGSTIPFQMVTQGFFKKCKKMLVDDGVFAVNLCTTHYCYANHLRTIMSVFGEELYINEKMYNSVAYTARKHPIRNKNVGFSTYKIKIDELPKNSEVFNLGSV